MTSLHQVLAACRATGARMSPGLAAWLVAQEVETNAFDQPQLGQALIDLMGGPGPEPLASVVSRMVHPDIERRFPADRRELGAVLQSFVRASRQAVGPAEVAQFMAGVEALPPTHPSGEWLTGRPQLDAAGRVLGQQPRAESPEAFAPPAAPDEALELDRPAPRPANEWSEPAPYRDEVPQTGPRKGLIAVLALAGLAVAVLIAFMAIPTLEREIPVPLPGRSAAPLLIDSTPGGATIFIDGENVGVTPLATENRWRGKPKLELRLDGYQPFTDTFEGGKKQSVAATLKRKK